MNTKTDAAIVRQGTDYYWCFLRNGDRETCGFIPARGARVGALVEMVDLDGEMWEVTSRGEGVSREYVRDQERRFKDFQGSLLKSGGGID